MTSIIEESLSQVLPSMEQKESIKLTKNAKGDYQWEIKILSLDIDQLQKLDQEMRIRFNEKGGVN